MKLQDKLRVKTIIRNLAQRNDTTPAAIRASMQECIDAAWNNPAGRTAQLRLFPEGKPSVEQFLICLEKEIK